MNDSDLYSERSPLLTETNDEETKDASSSSVDESTKESDSRSCSRKHNSLFSCRNVLALYLYAAFALVYAMRANLSVAIVTMVNQTFAEGSSLKINPESECHPAHNVSLDEDGQFNWDQKTRGLVLSSFFYGYIVTQIPGGWLASRYGGKSVLGLGILCTAALTLLTPIAAQNSIYLLIILRILEGVGEGLTYPAAAVLWSRWAPPLERSKYLVFVFTGADFGTVVALPLAGVLCNMSFAGGWPLAFYTFGFVGVLWFIPWAVFIYESPAEHPRISNEEREYIENSIGSAQDKTTKAVPVPWAEILKSIPMWSLSVAMFVNSFGWYVFLTSLPSYFKEVLGFHITQNGGLSAVPFICAWLFKNVSANLCDRARAANLCSNTAIRKIFCTVAFLTAMAFLLPVGFLGCHQAALAVVLLSMTCGCGGIFAPVSGANQLDLSPRFAGILMGITNTVSNFPGVLAPEAVGQLTNNEPTRGQWQKVFYITCGLNIIGCIQYALLGSGKEQPWNSPAQHHNGNDVKVLVPPPMTIQSTSE